MGDLINSDTRALLIILRIASVDFTFVPVDTMKGEHKTDKFLKEHPSGFLPVLIDGDMRIYGDVLVQITHVARRFQKVNDRLNFKEYFKEVDQQYGFFRQRVKPLSIRFSRMILRPIATAEEKQPFFQT